MEALTGERKMLLSGAASRACRKRAKPNSLPAVMRRDSAGVRGRGGASGGGGRAGAPIGGCRARGGEEQGAEPGGACHGVVFSMNTSPCTVYAISSSVAVAE